MYEKAPSLKQPREDKLFDFHTPLGIPNKLLLEKLKRAHNSFEGVPGFVGIAVNGSLTKGYSTSESDIDGTLLYDSSEFDQGDKSDLIKEFHRQNNMKRLGKRHSHFYHWTLRDINLSTMSGEPESVAEVFRLVTGTKINSYRNHWVEKIRRMSDEDSKSFIGLMAWSLARKDAHSTGWEKMTERMTLVSRGKPMGGLQDFARENWLRAISQYRHTSEFNYEISRSKLWEGRIQHFVEQ